LDFGFEVGKKEDGLGKKGATERWKKAVAAAAMVALMTSSSFATPIFPENSALPYTEWIDVDPDDPKPNTLLSVVVVNQSMENIGADIKVQLFVKGMEPIHLESNAGFFHHDFGNTIPANSSIQLIIPKQKIHKNHGDYEYKSVSRNIYLQAGQNVTVMINEEVEWMLEMGDFDMPFED
ncbi:MAG: hypothetical protein AAF570_28255, partial [Bacteroidota bacterium]